MAEPTSSIAELSLREAVCGAPIEAVASVLGLSTLAALTLQVECAEVCLAALNASAEGKSDA